MLEDFPNQDEGSKQAFNSVFRECIQDVSSFRHVHYPMRSMSSSTVLRNGNGIGDLVQTFLRAEKRPRISKEGVYVLKFTDSMKPSFYVGKSKDIGLRIQQHADGNGARCVSGRSFTEIRPVTAGTPSDMESWERNEVLELMYQYGINAVRGWKYTIANMPLAQKLSAFDDVCERFDLCRRCGRGTHFVRDCESLTTNRWADGLELRSVYHMQPIQNGLDEALEKAMAEVEEERRKRLEAERKNAEAVRILLAQANDDGEM